MAAPHECVLITGASSDIGCELIRQIGSQAIQILGHYNGSPAKLKALGDNVPGLNLVPIQADFARDEEVRALVATIQNDYAAPDKIVHLAAPRCEYHRFKES